MVKRGGSLLLALCLCITAGGCQRQKPLANAPDTGLELCSITSGGQMAETADGYFFRYFGTLYYADKGAMDNWVPVCNQPDCTHELPDCPAQVSGDFYLEDNRIYTIRHTWDFDTSQENREAVYSMALDGSDLRLEYEIEGSDYLSQGGMGLTIVRPGEVLAYYSALQPDGSYQNRIVRANAAGSQTLFTGKATELVMGTFLSGCYRFCMRGDFALCSNLMSEEDQGTEQVYTLTGEGLVEIPGICDYDLFGAYLQGDELRRFVPDDGYYTTNLTGNTSEKTMDAQLTGSVAYYLTGQYIVETNLMFQAMPEEPEMRLYDGNSWHEVKLPDDLPLSEDMAYPILSISSDCIFFGASEKTSIKLYYINLDKSEYEAIFCGELKN